MDTNTYIRQQVKARVKPNSHQATPPTVSAQSVSSVVPEEERGGFMTKFLGICILLMAVVIFFAGIARGMGWTDRSDPTTRITMSARPPVTPQPKIIERQIDNPDYARRAEVAEVESKLAALKKSHDVWKHRVWLLGIANNENAAVARKLDQQYHGNRDSGYISFDEHWKMSHMPKSMELTPEQRDSLRKNVK